MPFLEGFGYGLATMLLIGPVFFTLLKGALDHGTPGGVAVAVGIIASDLLIVGICLSGLAAVVEHWLSGPWIAVVAGVMLLAIGIRYIAWPVVFLEQAVRGSRKSMAGLLAAGFLVNFINPFVFAIWIAAVLHATHVHGTDAYAFALGMLTGIFLTDLGKAALAPRLRSALSPHLLRRMHLVIGSAMVLFSIRLFLHAAERWG